MAKQATCHTCVYAHWDPGLWLRTLGSGFPARAMCANQPDSFGRIRECPVGGVCRSYRARPPTPQGENVKMIPLTDGYYAYVDAADFEELSQWHWHAHNGYAARYEKNRPVYMHRQIMQPPKGMLVDHINSNKFDNTRANLRNVTRQQNMANARKHSDGAFIYKGITRAGKGGAWYAQAGFAGCHLRVGPFREEAEAQAKRKALRAKAARARRQKGEGAKKTGVKSVKGEKGVRREAPRQKPRTRKRDSA